MSFFFFFSSNVAVQVTTRILLGQLSGRSTIPAPPDVLPVC